MLYYAQNGQALLLGAWWWFVPPGAVHRPDRHRPRRWSISGSTRSSTRGCAPRRTAAPACAAAGAAVLETAGDGPLAERPGGTGLSVDVRRPREAPCTRSATCRSTLRRGEILGLAGESGSGKSTLAYGMTRLLRPPAHVTAGEVTLPPAPTAPTGGPVDARPGGELRRFRWKELVDRVPGGDELAQPGQHHRRQIDDVIRTHRTDLTQGRRRARSGTARARGHRRRAGWKLSARTLRRDAPARDDRHGTRPEP